MLTLALVLAVAACGGDVRSQDEPGDERIPGTDGAQSSAAVSPPSGGEVSPGLDSEGPREETAGTPVGGAAPGAVPPPVAPPTPPVAEAAPSPTPATRAPAPSEAAPPPVEPQRTDLDPPPLTPPVPAPDVAPPPAIPAGTELTTHLVAELHTSVNRAGDRFTARVEEDVLGPNGVVWVPRGSEVLGRVVESRESDGPDSPAVLRLEVDGLRVDGRDIEVRASVLEAEFEAEARDSGTRTAAKVASGAAAGAVLGRILGRDSRSTAAGAVAGAAAGTAVALSTRGGQAVMLPGSRIVIRILDPVPHLR